MGKRKGVKKVHNTKKIKNGDGETTSIATSSSLTSVEISEGSNHTTEREIKIEGGNANKKINREDLLTPPGQVEAGQSQGSEIKQVSMDNLPPEMLTNILKCVDTQNLFKCRLVNRNWSSISSGILCKRSDACIRFELDSKNEFLWCAFQDGQRSLNQFVKSMKKTKNNPYSHFTLSITSTSSQSQVFDQKDFKEFLSDFASASNQRLKSLTFRLDFKNEESMEKFTFFTAKFADLLLNKIPCLEELSLYFPYSIKSPQLKYHKLFPTPQQQQQDSETDTTGKVPFPVSAQVQLGNLKVIRFEVFAISYHSQIMTDLLNAAVNLSWFRVSIARLHELQFLESIGKLDLLREAEISIYDTFFSSMENNTYQLPKLENLDLKIRLTVEDESVFPPTTSFLSNLFESSKDSLQVLAIQPLGHFSNLQLPTFTNLRKLSISQTPLAYRYNADLTRIFPRGIRSTIVFPAVSDLGLDLHSWKKAFYIKDSIPLLPRVTTLNLKNRDYNVHDIYYVTLLCPNLSKLKIQKYEDPPAYHVVTDYYNNFGYAGVPSPPKLDFLLVARSIWTDMKELECLEVDIDVDAPEHSSANLDFCFTGISPENCQRLYNLTNKGKMTHKPEFQEKLAEFTEREHPSILDMKDLKRLIIHPYLGGHLMDNEKEFYTKKLTWISREYAFKLMPQLELNDY